MADISRADALTLIRSQNGAEIWQAVPEFSAAMRTFRKVNMGTKLVTYPIIGALPNAAFVAGEDADDAASLKPTTSMAWTSRDLTAEEIAGIVVIPENVIDDASSDFDLWAEIKPRIAEAVGATLDAACFFGTNAPASWPDGIVPAAIAASNFVVEGTSIPEGAGAANDLAEDINATIGEVEEDGYDPTSLYARRTLRQRVRGLRDANNAPIYTTSVSETGRNVPAIYGVDTEYVTNGAWDSAVATLVAGDPRFAILGIRQDLQFKLLDQAAVTIGSDLVSLAEHDLLGLRFKMRVGFQTAQTLTKDGGSGAYPFAVLTPTAPGS
jgi:HK97 family phage major capsid protein